MSSTNHRSTVEEALARADADASEGRALEAIDALSTLNRAGRDPQIESRLVDLRHRAFSELAATAGRSVWPGQFADPFPGALGIPAAAPEALSGDLIGGALTHHGCVQIPGLVEASTVVALRDEIERSFTARERLNEGGAVEAVAPWFVPYAPGREKAERFGRDHFIRAVDCPGVLWTLVELFLERGVTRAVTEYLGERPAMIANKWVLRRSPSGGGTLDFHQDGAFLGDGIRTVNCWIALSDCGPGTGRPGLDLFPQRYDVLPTGEPPAFLSWSIAKSTVLEARPDVPVHRATFAAGDALMFDDHLPHRTGVGHDLTTRYAIESWFVAPSSYPAKHLPVVL